MVVYVCYELYVLDCIGRSTRRQGQRKFPFFVKVFLDFMISWRNEVISDQIAIK